MSLDIDWTGYMRVHSDRRNLIIHLIAAPLFVVAIVFLVYSLLRADFMASVIAVVGALAAMLLQGRGHALEAHAPEAFSGPGNFLRRWFREQFLVFPVFFLTGRWWQQFKGAAEATEDAA